MTTYIVYHILTPESISTEAFADLFSIINNDGVEELEDAIKVYISKDNVDDFESELNQLFEVYPSSFTKEVLENKNWNEEWERNFQALRIDDFVGIRADFHPHFENVKYEIVINPKMSFGTGHHATTKQMIQMMALLEVENKKILDCGSGTGILAILAKKMNADRVIAFDNDEWSYNNHEENAIVNQVSTELVLGSLQDISENNFDIVLANIHKNFIVENMFNLAARVKSSGYLIVSGFLPSDIRDILLEAQRNNLLANYMTQSENWACILLQKTK